MALEILTFGTTASGAPAHLYVLRNARGMSVAVTDIGASVVAVRVPDARGNLLDVALGHAGPAGYEDNACLFGATVGRVANRTAGARFTLDGVEHRLADNNHGNNNHSGPDLWSTRLWHLRGSSGDEVILGLDSPAGDQGFPGEASAQVSYRLTDGNELVVYQSALLTERSPVNMTNHTYWNLDGHASGSALGHTLQVSAGRYLPTDGRHIPTGELADVVGTPFDLREARPLESVAKRIPAGLDHSYCLDGSGQMRDVARLTAARSGITLDVHTDAPGLQVYMAGGLDVAHGKDGMRYGSFAGVALEAQHWPDSLHHDDWPSVIYGPSRPFVQTIRFAFGLIGA